MFKLYTIFKIRSGDRPPSNEELDIAQGRKVLDPSKAKAWFNNLEAASENIRQAFERQTTAAAVSIYSHFITILLTSNRVHGIKKKWSA